MNVVLYLRYSSDRQTEQSIEGQRHVCESYCRANGYTVVGEYVDRAASASHDTEKRVSFQRMIKDSTAHGFEAVVVYKLDRFARNRYDSATYKARLKRNGVRVVSATETITDSPEGIILESVLEGMAEFYSMELAQKVRRGMAESARKCNSTGGTIPLGYKIIDKKYQIDEATAPVVREIFERYAAGEKLSAISDSLNKRGIRTACGAQFTRSSYCGLLRNRKYTGVYTYAGTETDGGIPAIIDRDTFDRAQERLDRTRSAPAHEKAEEPYALSGRVYCGHCGALMVGDCGRSRTGTLYHYYTCAAHKKSPHDCGMGSVRKDWLERTVAEQAREVLTPEFIGAVADAAEKQAREEAENDTTVKAIEAEMRETKTAIANLLHALEQGATSPSLFARLDALEEQRTALERRLEDARVSTVSLDRSEIVYFLTGFANGDIDDPEYRQMLLTVLVRSVTVYEDGEHKKGSPHRDLRLSVAYNLKPSPATDCGCSDLAVNEPPYATNPNHHGFVVFPCSASFRTKEKRYRF